MKLIYTVEVRDTDDVNSIEYLSCVQAAFTAIMDLNAFGYSDDEVSASSLVEIDNGNEVLD